MKNTDRNIIKFMRSYLKVLGTEDATAIMHYTGLNAVSELENKFKKFYNYNYCLSFSSATNALTAVAISLGLKKSKIITSPVNYVASVGGLLHLNNKLVFVDVNNDLNINTDLIEKEITDKVKAIWVVDFAGNPHDMVRLREIANKYKLYYIADASQSFGAFIGGGPASSLADILVVSLTNGKTLSAGEGAAILTNNADLYYKLLNYIHPYRVMIERGLDNISEVVCINGRINPVAAFLGNINFNNALEKISLHQEKCQKLHDFLMDSKIVKLPDLTGTSSYFYCYAFDNNNCNITEINAVLKNNKISFKAIENTHIKPLFTESFFKKSYYNYKSVNELVHAIQLTEKIIIFKKY